MTDSDELLGLLIPLCEHSLLLPHAAVAEVIGYRDAEPMAAVPDWLLGQIHWRRNLIPLVSFERAAGLSYMDPGHRARICVCNTLKEDSRLPYVGIVARGIPRLVRVNTENVAPMLMEEGVPFIREKVDCTGEPSLIPDLDALEQAIDAVV